MKRILLHCAFVVALVMGIQATAQEITPTNAGPYDALSPGNQMIVDAIYNSQLASPNSLAGGLLPSAKEEYSLVMRREGLDTVLGLRLDVKAILAGIAVQNDIELRNEDVIYIPKTRMASAGDWMQEFDRIIGPPINILFKALQSRTLLLQLELLENQR